MTARVMLVMARSAQDLDPYALEPLGLLYLAAALEQGGFSVTVRDHRRLPLRAEPGPNDPQALLEAIRSADATVVGFSCVAANTRVSLDLAWAVGRHLPGVRVVFGGPHPSALPEPILAEPFVDAVVVGEAEVTFPTLLRAWDAGSSGEGLPGVGIRGGAWGPGAPPLDVDALPLPARHLLPPDRSGGRLAPAVVMGSRGCTHRCAYCGKLPGAVGVRRRDPSRVVEEVRGLVEAHPGRPLTFVDDVFTADPAWLVATCTGLASLPGRPMWECSTRVDALQDRHLALLSQAGCRTVRLGIESGSPAVLLAMGKTADPQAYLTRARHLVGAIRAAGMGAVVHVLVGFPTETRRDLWDTARFLASLPTPRQVSVYACTPVPGSRLWEQRHRLYGAGTGDKVGIRMEDLERADLKTPVVDTPHFTRRQLVLWRRLLLARYFGAQVGREWARLPRVPGEVWSRWRDGSPLRTAAVAALPATADAWRHLVGGRR